MFFIVSWICIQVVNLVLLDPRVRYQDLQEDEVLGGVSVEEIYPFLVFQDMVLVNQDKDSVNQDKDLVNQDTVFPNKDKASAYQDRMDKKLVSSSIYTLQFYL